MNRKFKKSNAIKGKNKKGLCRYTNQASHFQIIRIVNLPNFFFERVVFPGEQLVFEANFDAQLEVHSGSLVSAVLSDTIPCYRLALERVNAKSDKNLDQFYVDKADNRTVLA